VGSHHGGQERGRKRNFCVEVQKFVGVKISLTNTRKIRERKGNQFRGRAAWGTGELSKKATREPFIMGKKKVVRRPRKSLPKKKSVRKVQFVRGQDSTNARSREKNDCLWPRPQFLFVMRGKTSSVSFGTHRGFHLIRTTEAKRVNSHKTEKGKCGRVARAESHLNAQSQ